MGRQKNFFCDNCETKHQRPVGRNCSRKKQCLTSSSDDSDVGAGSSSDNGQKLHDIGGASDMNAMLLAEMKNISKKMHSMEQRIASTEQQLRASASTQSQSAVIKKKRATAPLHKDTESSSEDDSTESADDELVLPTKKFIRKNASIQRQVDARIEELKKLNEQDLKGNLKSQRSINDEVIVKCKVPWPQNHVLTGSTRSRPSYDSLSIFQWVTGFTRIIQDEKNVEIKDKMLEYMADLMEDAQDFSWASAKACHAVVLCRMEEGKVVWSDTERIDRVRRSYAQKVLSNKTTATSNGNGEKNKALVCKFYQDGSCSHTKDHTTGGRRYKHNCSSCNGSHPLKECKAVKNKAKNE